MSLGITPSEIVESGNQVLLCKHESWKRVKILDIANVLNGFAFKSNKFNSSTGKPIIRIRDVGKKENETYYDGDWEKTYLIKKGDILVGMDGDFRCAIWQGKNALLNQRVCKIELISKFYNKSFFVYLLQPYLDAINKETSSVTVKHLSSFTISEIPIPLPPLPEQHRIVAKLEELFSELDSAIEALRKAKDQVKTYKQAVLKAAFSGKLTIKNEELKINKETGLPEGWKWVKVGDICNVVRGGSPRPAGNPKYYDGKIPFLKVADITKDNEIYLKSFQYTIKEAGLYKTRQIKPNTLLLSNSGATLGVPKICMIDATMNDGIAAFLDLDTRSILYLYYFWLSKTLELRNINMGAAQPNLNTSIIKNVEIPYCSFKEQKQIVSEIETRFSEAENLEKTIDLSLKQAESLRQSILKKAFEGRLVPQNPDDEPASLLLDKIKQEKLRIKNSQLTIRKGRMK